MDSCSHKGIVHPKMKIVIIYSSSFHPKSDFFFFVESKEDIFKILSTLFVHTLKVNGNQGSEITGNLGQKATKMNIKITQIKDTGAENCA